MKRIVLALTLIPVLALAAGDVDEKRVVAESADGQNWFLKGGSFRGEHYSPLRQINAGNVGDLGLAWSIDLPVPDGVSATPIIVDGVIYISGAWSIVFAVDAASGEILWSYDPKVLDAIANHPSRSWTSRVNRGVAVWQGSVFVATSDCRLISINASTGAENWSRKTCDNDLGYTISDSPYVGGDMVFIGNAGSESGRRNRGYVSAYSAAAGELLWRFYIVPSADPVENDTAALKMAAATWSGDALERFGGGGSNWNEMTYDPESGLLYFGTAGALPYLHRERSPGGGDNLFLSSIIAVNAATGEYVWHYQTTPEDSWEYNATMNIVLADLEFDGEARKTLLVAPKNGFHYTLDRETGELLNAGKYAKVNWATHINLETGRPVLDPAAEFWNHPEEPQEVWPNMWGAHSWNPMAYHPVEELVYIPVIDVPSIATFWEGDDYSDTLEMVTEVDGEPFAPGKLVAWDPVANEPRWTVEYELPFNGGVMTTAGNLVFQGDAMGRFNAYRATDGGRLWSVETGSPISAAPSSFEFDGMQYVVLPVGGAGGAQFVYPEMHAGEHVRGPTRLMAFALDRNESMPEIATDTRVVPPPPAIETTAQQVARGKELYAYRCTGCHGKNGVARYGGSVPDLRFTTAEIHRQWTDIVTGGGRSEKGMPKFDISKEDALAIQAYLLSLSEELRASRNSTTDSK